MDTWFELTKERLYDDPLYRECWSDPRRIFNQDETSICAGTEHERVLAPVGYQRPVYHMGGSSRDHTSLSTVINGDGSKILNRIIYKGVRNRSEKIAHIPRDGITGPWKCSVSPEGYMTGKVFCEVIDDIVEHVEAENIPKPVCINIQFNIQWGTHKLGQNFRS